MAVEHSIQMHSISYLFAFLQNSQELVTCGGAKFVQLDMNPLSFGMSVVFRGESLSSKESKPHFFSGRSRSEMPMNECNETNRMRRK